MSQVSPAFQTSRRANARAILPSEAEPKLGSEAQLASIS